MLGPLLLLIHINDLPDRIKSICKIFADDTSLFSKVTDKACSNIQLNDDLNKNKRNDKRFNKRAYSLFFLMAIFLKHL